MAFIQSANPYDVCIVGSGAGGGMSAYVLARAGLNVLLLEAGQDWDAGRDGHMLTWNHESPRRGAGTPDMPFGEFDGCIGGWNLEGEPYTKAEGTEWDWFRARMLGGRTNHWGRISLRFGPDDFRRKTLDGAGDDWPIGYEDLKPYYDRLDRTIGLFGSMEGMENEPDGIFQAPPAPRCHERKIMEAGGKLGIPVVANRLSVITEPTGGRPACHYCGQCGRGCSSRSNFSVPSVLLPDARASGNLTIRHGAMVRRVLTNDEGRATGVSFVDRNTLMEEQVSAKAVVLAASACESARLLLNSSSNQHPNGLANSSDAAGRYLMDSTGADVMGFVPELAGRAPENEDGVGGAHVYIPWWLDGKKTDFRRGYHIEVWGGRGMPGYGFGGGIHRMNGTHNAEGIVNSRGGGGYGAQLKADYRYHYGATVGFSGRGEMIARRENHCAIDPTTVDRYGIPVLRFDVTWSDEELRQVKHFQETGYAMLEAMGADPYWEMPDAEANYGITRPGQIIHEVGTTRMGDDPRTSVLNSFCQAHDADNVFIADAGPLVSQPHKNCTWTILALAMRTSEYIVEQFRLRNI
ncbi:MAG: choline dehydrogenase-like flavoprotein [Rhodothermales bacterium]|jgi:choline dehydrogenase-like flavoprotein